MRTFAWIALLAPSLALGQVQASASFSLNLPAIIPPLVVIEPGIRVIPDLDVEVFHVDGFYWTHREGRWYRSSNPKHGWVHHPHGYPPGLSKLPPGKYKRWKGGPSKPAFRAPPPRHDDRRDRHDRRDDDHGGKHKGGKKHGKRD